MPKNGRKALAALTVLLLMGACAAAPEPPPAPAQTSLMAAHGEAIAQRLCTSCHAIGADGDSPLAAAPPLRTLAERYPVGALQEAFAEGILVGHPAMPEFAFNPEEIDALLAYLELIQERRGG